jgi:hypothetical protein
MLSQPALWRLANAAPLKPSSYSFVDRGRTQSGVLKPVRPQRFDQLFLLRVIELSSVQVVFLVPNAGRWESVNRALTEWSAQPQSVEAAARSLSATRFRRFSPP